MGNGVNYSEIIAKIVIDASGKLLGRYVKKLEGAAKKLSIHFEIPFKEYLEKSYEKYSRVKTLLYNTEPKHIYSFFECNDFRYGSSTVEGLNVNNILELSRYILIQGSGGVGKSTMLKHFFISCIEETGLIPLFFELKDISFSEGYLEDELYSRIVQLGFGLEKEYFLYALKEGLFLILLDGIDEVPGNILKDFISALDRLCDQYGENHFIVTSRPISDFIEYQRFTILKTIPFSKEKAMSLVRKLDYDPEIGRAHV